MKKGSIHIEGRTARVERLVTILISLILLLKNNLSRTGSQYEEGKHRADDKK